MLLGAAASTVALVWLAADRTRDAQAPAAAPAGQTAAIKAARETRAGADGATPATEGPAPLWRAVDPRSVAAKPPFEDVWPKAGRTLLDMSAATAAAPTWRVGDRVRIDVPQLGTRRAGRIDQLNQLGHSIAASGRTVAADGPGRRFVVTVGPGRVFAYIDTPAWPYELAADDQLGWLLPSASMMAGFDCGHPDHWPPEAQDQHRHSRTSQRPTQRKPPRAPCRPS